LAAKFPIFPFLSAFRASWPALREEGWKTFSLFVLDVFAVFDVLAGAMVVAFQEI